MKSHPHIRAYLAGIAAPTVFLIIVLTAIVIMRFVVGVKMPVEQVMVFGMGLVPNLWGLWNVLFLRLPERWNIPLGIWGAILPLLIAPLGYELTQALGLEIPEPVRTGLPFAFPIVLIAYYLVWKYVVGFLNGLLGIERV